MNRANASPRYDDSYLASRGLGSAHTEFLHRDGKVTLTDLGNGKRRLRAESSRPDVYIHRELWDTAYSDELIGIILHAKGVGFVCDEMMRDEDPTYVRSHVELTVRAHVDPLELAGGDVLDFGCGAGASTVILSQMLPTSRITGVDLNGQNLSIARGRAAFYGLLRTRFIQSPDGSSLPKSLGPFRAIMLSAVFEHLLPSERKALMPILWSMLEPGGVLFIDETPSRWFPVETHTTGLPLINYLPDRLAAAYARWCSSRVSNDETWERMQRAGIRGGSVREILRLLPAQHGRPILLEPHRLGIKDALDLWIRGYVSGASQGGLKRKAVPLLRLASRLVDSASLVPYLSLAIRKSAVRAS
jgi:2-polyprenyl-3-methyl-5-hydroxy-6-metoxy-1,4-benzoquinol methylase